VMSRLHKFKKTDRAKIAAIVVVGILIIVASAAFAYSQQSWQKQLQPAAQMATPVPSPSPRPSPSPSPSASPSPKPMSFVDMNKLDGPCAVVPTLMYHHIEDLTKAKAEGHASLSVAPDAFQRQMQELKDKGYTVISMADLNAFFDSGAGLPHKPVLLTFDDAYDDFGSQAWPILQQFGYRATLFVPTGLLENPGYLTWNTVKSFGGQVLSANHTWSHRSMTGNRAIDEKEITTADTQLSDHGLDQPKVFSYPYGNPTGDAENILVANNYTLAFTTNPGSTLCKKQRLVLPRRRIGNAPLSAYGL
jgi:peptidoglycan/xylan/chitin deacetylase (PgdA/CDA1 family)